MLHILGEMSVLNLRTIYALISHTCIFTMHSLASLSIILISRRAMILWLVQPRAPTWYGWRSSTLHCTTCRFLFVIWRFIRHNSHTSFLNISVLTSNRYIILHLSVIIKRGSSLRQYSSLRWHTRKILQGLLSQLLISHKALPVMRGRVTIMRWHILVRFFNQYRITVSCQIHIHHVDLGVLVNGKYLRRSEQSGYSYDSSGPWPNSHTSPSLRE